MPDEIDALRQFRDETPGPSTDAWNRARAAVAAARAEEAPARRRRAPRSPARPTGLRSPARPTGLRSPDWPTGLRSPGRGPGRRRMLVIATGCVLAAAAAGLVAVLLPGAPGTHKTGAQIETTAFVTRVEHALSASNQRNFVGYNRTVYPRGYSVEPVAPGAIHLSPATSVGSLWSAGSLVRWSYRDVFLVSAFSAAGYRVFDLSIARTGGTLASTAVLYRSHTWWRGVIGPATAPVAPTRCGSGIELGTGGWLAFLRYELSCGEFTQGGQQRIGGAEAVRLTGDGGREVFWVNRRTYLPVRAVFATSTGARLRTDFGWFAPTRARVAGLHLSVPPGFRQVPAPAPRLGR
jgi:hypothetical protein